MPSPVLHRSLHSSPLPATHASGHYVHLVNGQRVLDASGGAAVSCIGHSHPAVLAAMTRQQAAMSYAASTFFTHAAGEELASVLVSSTDGAMSHALIVGSGSEAIESALKLARQYHVEKGEPQRCHFIARKPSYHGNTLGALSVSGHLARRKPYEPLLATGFSWVGLANAYRGAQGDATSTYVERLQAELEAEFRRVGPETVCAVVMETVVGAAAGCVPPPPGYLAAVRAVCDAHGALLLLDEVMCGMGRCGSLHAWQAEGVAPDIQTLGKGLGGGYAPVAAVLVSPKVSAALSAGSGAFVNGFTYQAHPASCAAALAVQRVLRQDKLVQRAREVGEVLGGALRDGLADCEWVGDVRGRGMFWAVEIVRDRKSKRPFEVELGMAFRVQEEALKAEAPVLLYPGQGCAEGGLGDHIIIAPPFTITLEEIEVIVHAAKRAIERAVGEVLGEVKERARL